MRGILTLPHIINSRNGNVASFCIKDLIWHVAKLIQHCWKNILFHEFLTLAKSPQIRFLTCRLEEIKGE